MSANHRDDPSGAKTNSEGWKALYLVGGIAALLAFSIFRRNWGVELMTFSGFGLFDVPETWPVTTFEWYELLQLDRYISLSLLGLYDVINYALVGLIFMALYGALRGANRGARLVALVSGLVGVTVFISSNPAVDMLALSERYSTTASVTERPLVLAAGEALLAHHNPVGPYHGTGYYISLFLVLVAGLIFSIVMLRSDVFNKWTAITGILANGINLFLFPVQAFAPSINWIPPTFAAPFRVAWYILIMIQLFKLSRRDR